MPKKTLHARVGDDRLRVENTWLSGVTLFLNDQAIGFNESLFAVDKNTPLISVDAVVDGKESLIEVFVWAILTVKIQIAVDRVILKGTKR